MQTIDAKLSQSKRVYLILGVFVLLCFSLIIPLANDKGDHGALFAVLFAIIFAGFIFALIKYAGDKVELELTSSALRETSKQTNQMRQIDFSDIAEYGVVYDGRGNYWIRIKLKSTGKTLKYFAASMKFANKQTFKEFGQEVQSKLRAFTSGTPTAASVERSSAVPSTAATGAMAKEQIKFGLSKSEKTGNVMIMIYRVIWLVVTVVAIFGYIASSGYSSSALVLGSLGILAIIALAYWLIKRKSIKQV